MKFTFVMCFFLISYLNIFSQSIKIIEQSRDEIRCQGENIELKIDATGKNLVYQWFFNEIKIENANNYFFKINKLSYENSGIYTCLIKDDEGNQLLSDPIPLYVTIGTKILQQPRDQYWILGDTVSFETFIHYNSENEKPINIQWYKVLTNLQGTNTREGLINLGIDPDEITLMVNDFTEYDTTVRALKLWPLLDGPKFAGSKTLKLEVKNATYTDQTNYYCQITGACNTILSRRAIFGESAYFAITKIGYDYFNCVGGEANFLVNVKTTKPGALKYQWYKLNNKLLQDGAKFQGTNTPHLTMKDVQRYDNGGFYVIVTNTETGTEQQSPLFICTPKYPPVISRQPKDFIMNERSNPEYTTGLLYLTCFVENDDSVKIEVYKNSKYLMTFEKKGGIYYYFPANKDSIGNYKFKMINSCGSTWSDSVNVGFNYPDVWACNNGKAVLTVDTMPKNSSYFYKWYHENQKLPLEDNIIISGAKTNSLTIKNAQPIDSGYYSVWAIKKDFSDSIFVGKIFLQLNYGPKIVKDMPDTIHYNGKVYMHKYFTFTTFGKKISVQKLVNGLPFGSIKTSNVLNVSDYFRLEDFGGVLPIKEGTIQYKVWDDCGTTFSKTMLIVLDTTIKDSEIILEGDNDNNEQTISSVVKGLDNTIIDIYPNPANDIINLAFIGEISEEILNIYSLEGIIVKSIAIQNSHVQIDISDLLSGYYYINYNNKLLKFIKY